MPTTLRRDVISSSAVAVGFACWGQKCALVAPEEGQQTPAARMPSQHNPKAPVPRAKTPDRYKVGDAEITTSYHGIWEKVHNGRYVGNATVAKTKQAQANADLTTEFVPNLITAFAVKLNSKLILGEAGGGGTPVPPNTWNHAAFELRAK